MSKKNQNKHAQGVQWVNKTEFKTLMAWWDKFAQQDVTLTEMVGEGWKIENVSYIYETSGGEGGTTRYVMLKRETRVKVSEPTPKPAPAPVVAVTKLVDVPKPSPFGLVAVKGISPLDEAGWTLVEPQNPKRGFDMGETLKSGVSPQDAKAMGDARIVEILSGAVLGKVS